MQISDWFKLQIEDYINYRRSNFYKTYRYKFDAWSAYIEWMYDASTVFMINGIRISKKWKLTLDIADIHIKDW